MFTCKLSFRQYSFNNIIKIDNTIQIPITIVTFLLYMLVKLPIHFTLFYICMLTNLNDIVMNLLVLYYECVFSTYCILHFCILALHHYIALMA